MSPQKLRELAKESSNDGPKIYGYREAYHRLTYSKDHQCLIDWWQEHGYDCTAEEACDYFMVPISSTGQRNKNDRIDKKTREMLLIKMK